MQLEYIIITAIALITMATGYLYGWRAGHLAAVRLMWEDAIAYASGEEVDMHLPAQFTRETVEQVAGKSVWQELLDDEVYQAQLRAQDEDE